MITLIKYIPIRQRFPVFRSNDNISLYYECGRPNRKIHIGTFMESVLCGFHTMMGQFTNNSETYDFMRMYQVDHYCKKCLSKVMITDII